MKKFFIIAFAAIMALGCSDAQKKAITDAEVDAAILLTNTALNNIDFEDEMKLSMERVDEVVVLNITQQLGDEAATLQFAGLMAGDLAVDYALSSLCQYPEVVAGLDEVFEFGYDIRIEYHDFEQGKIIAVPITRADLEKYR
jgi:hypothetical protein